MLPASHTLCQGKYVLEIYTPQFKYTVNDTVGNGNTFWVVTVNGTEYHECTQNHSSHRVRMCGLDYAFESSPSGQDGNKFTSTLTTVSSIQSSLNGTNVQCAGLFPDNVIGSSEVCITGKIVMC